VAVIIIISVDNFSISMAKFDGLLLFRESKNDVDESRSEERVIVGNVPAVKAVNDFVEKGQRYGDIFTHHELPPINSCSTTILTILSSRMVLRFCAPYMSDSTQDLLIKRGIPPENLKSSSMAASVNISLSVPA